MIDSSLSPDVEDLLRDENEETRSQDSQAVPPQKINSVPFTTTLTAISTFATSPSAFIPTSTHVATPDSINTPSNNRNQIQKPALSLSQQGIKPDSTFSTPAKQSQAYQASPSIKSQVIQPKMSTSQVFYINTINLLKEVIDIIDLEDTPMPLTPKVSPYFSSQPNQKPLNLSQQTTPQTIKPNYLNKSSDYVTHIPSESSFKHYSTVTQVSQGKYVCFFPLIDIAHTVSMEPEDDFDTSLSSLYPSPYTYLSEIPAEITEPKVFTVKVSA